MLRALPLNNAKTSKKIFEPKSDIQNKIDQSLKESLFFSLLMLSKEEVEKKGLSQKEGELLINGPKKVEELKQDIKRMDIVLKSLSSKTELEEILQNADIKNRGKGVSLKELFNIAKKSGIEIKKIEIAEEKEGKELIKAVVKSDKKSKRVVIKKEQIESIEESAKREKEVIKNDHKKERSIKTEDRFKFIENSQKVGKTATEVQEGVNIGLKEVLAIKDGIKKDSPKVNTLQEEYKKEPKELKNTLTIKEKEIGREGIKQEQKEHPKAVLQLDEERVEPPKEREKIEKREEKEIKSEAKKIKISSEPKGECIEVKDDNPKSEIESQKEAKKDDIPKNRNSTVNSKVDVNNRSDRKEQTPQNTKAEVVSQKEQREDRVEDEPLRAKIYKRDIEVEHHNQKYKTEKKNTYTKDGQKVEILANSKVSEEKEEGSSKIAKNRGEPARESIRQSVTKSQVEGDSSPKEGLSKERGFDLQESIKHSAAKSQVEIDKSSKENLDKGRQEERERGTNFKEVDKLSEKANINQLKSDFSIRIAEAKESIRYLSERLKEEIGSYKPPFKKIELELKPKNLGKLDVMMVARGNNLHITLSSNTQALIMLAQNVGDFRNNLINLGFGSVIMNFSSNIDSSSSGGGQRGGYQNERNKNSLYESKEVNKGRKSASLELIIPRYV